jgi:hypothetical protein
MVAKKLLTTLFLIGLLFSWIAFIGCATSPLTLKHRKVLMKIYVKPMKKRNFGKTGATGFGDSLSL